MMSRICHNFVCFLLLALHSRTEKKEKEEGFVPQEYDMEFSYGILLILSIRVLPLVSREVGHPT